MTKVKCRGRQTFFLICRPTHGHTRTYPKTTIEGDNTKRKKTTQVVYAWPLHKPLDPLRQWQCLSLLYAKNRPMRQNGHHRHFCTRVHTSWVAHFNRVQSSCAQFHLWFPGAFSSFSSSSWFVTLWERLVSKMDSIESVSKFSSFLIYIFFFLYKRE